MSVTGAIRRSPSSWSGRRAGAPRAQQLPLFEVRVYPERRYFRQMIEALTRSGFGLDPSPGSALAAELTVARLFGTCWVSEPVPRDGHAQEAFGLGLVDYARQRRSPTSLALLRTLGVIAPIREVREAASAAAHALASGGIPEPPWSPPVGAVTGGRCWSFGDIYGDRATVICEFGYGADLRSAPRHAVAVQVDHAWFSTVANAALIDDVDPVVRELRYQAKRRAPLRTLRQVDPAWARALLVRAFARTDLIEGVEVAADVADVRAFALARLATLADHARALPEEVPPTAPQRQALATEFLASQEARSLPDPDQARRVAALIVEYAAIHDPGQLARVGPAKWGVFFDWYAGRSAGAMPVATVAPVLRAWSAWAGRRMGLPGLAREELAAALAELVDDMVAAGPL